MLPTPALHSVPSAPLHCSACVGTGMQLAFLCVFVILLTIAGSFFEERGTILTAFIVSYALTSFLGGFFGGGLYARNSGRCYVARPFCSLWGATTVQSSLVQMVSTCQPTRQTPLHTTLYLLATS